MNSRNIEISQDLAKELIPILEEQISELENQKISIDGEIRGKRQQLDELKLKIFGRADVKSNGEKKRFKKGEADTIIAELLRGLPANSGLTMKQIGDMTKVPYSSVFRLLKTPKKNKNRFIENDGIWTFAI